MYHILPLDFVNVFHRSIKIENVSLLYSTDFLMKKRGDYYKIFNYSLINVNCKFSFLNSKNVGEYVHKCVLVLLLMMVIFL